MTAATPSTPAGSKTGIGPFWRRLREKQRQAMAKYFPSMVDTTFTTPKSRQEFMEEEARQFASNIRLMEKDIRGLKLADETFMATCQQVLGSDLPRVYDFGEDGHVHAVGALDTIGRGTKMEDLQKVQIELSQGLEQDVLTPMKQWLFAWSTVQERLKELEEMRIEVDSRKRQVFALRQDEGKHKEAIDRAKSERSKKDKTKKLEDTWRKQQRKDAKLASATATYQSLESEVLEELAGLIRDAVCLKSYLAACTEFQREAYQSLTHCLLGTHNGGPSQQDSDRSHSLDRSSSPPRGGTGASSSSDNPFLKDKNVRVDLSVMGTREDSPVKATVRATSGRSMNTSGHSLYGDDIKLPSPESPTSPRARRSIL